MQYKLTDEKLIEDGTIEDQIIEKHGFVPTFTINQLKDNLVINSKRIKELKGQIELDSAKMKNIESHHPFIKDMTDFDRRVVHMYEESFAMAKACQTKLDEFEKQIEEDEEEIAAIQAQIPELAEVIKSPYTPETTPVDESVDAQPTAVTPEDNIKPDEENTPE